MTPILAPRISVRRYRNVGSSPPGPMTERFAWTSEPVVAGSGGLYTARVAVMVPC